MQSTNTKFHTDRSIPYASPGGKTLKMTLYFPGTRGEEVTRDRPGMVVIHGGGWVLGTRYQQAWYCREFAKAGYVVMTIDYRMLPRYGFPHCVHDAKAAVRWLRGHADTLRVDPDRIVTFGASAGGHLAGFLAATGPKHGFEGDENPGVSSEVRAGVGLYGVYDLCAIRKHEGVVRAVGEDLLRRFVGPDTDGRDAFEAASPVSYVSEETKPFMLVHGTSDMMVPFEQSQVFHDRLKEHRVPTELIAVEGRNHAFDYLHRTQRAEVFGAMLAFLNKHTAHEPEPAEERRHGDV